MIDKLINLDHPFFAKALRRYLTLAVCFGWGGFEASLGHFGWTALFIGLGGVAAWQFHRIDWSKYDGGR